MSSKRRPSGLVLFPAAKKSRQMSLIPVRPRLRTPKGSREGVLNGRATSGTSSPEIKNADVAIAMTPVSATPTIESLTDAIAEGTTGVTRVGQKILLKSLDCIFDVRATTSNTQASFADIILVWDKQPNAAIPTVGSIFVSPTTNLTYTNLNALERFVVLRREHVAFGDPFLGAGEVSKCLKWHVPLDLATRFPDATGSPLTNDLYIVALSPGVAASLNTISFTGICRLKYTDA